MKLIKKYKLYIFSLILLLIILYILINNTFLAKKFSDNTSFNTSTWQTYSDWQQNKFYLKYPQGWNVHTEVILMDSNKSFKENVQERPFESSSSGYFTIAGR